MMLLMVGKNHVLGFLVIVMLFLYIAMLLLFTTMLHSVCLLLLWFKWIDVHLSCCLCTRVFIPRFMWIWYSPVWRFFAQIRLVVCLWAFLEFLGWPFISMVRHFKVSHGCCKNLCGPIAFTFWFDPNFLRVDLDTLFGILRPCVVAFWILEVCLEFCLFVFFLLSFEV